MEDSKLENRDFGKLLREFQEIVDEAYDPVKSKQDTEDLMKRHQQEMGAPNKPTPAGPKGPGLLDKLKSLFAKKSAKPAAPAPTAQQQTQPVQTQQTSADITSIVDKMNQIVDMFKAAGDEETAAKLSEYASYMNYGSGKLDGTDIAANYNYKSSLDELLKKVEQILSEGSRGKGANTTEKTDKPKGKTEQTPAAAKDKTKAPPKKKNPKPTPQDKPETKPEASTTKPVTPELTNKTEQVTTGADSVSAASSGTAIAASAADTLKAAQATENAAKAEAAIEQAIKDDKLTMNDILAARGNSRIFGGKDQQDRVRDLAEKDKDVQTRNPTIGQLIRGARWSGFYPEKELIRQAIGKALNLVGSRDWQSRKRAEQPAAAPVTKPESPTPISEPPAESSVASAPVAEPAVVPPEPAAPVPPPAAAPVNQPPAKPTAKTALPSTKSTRGSLSSKSTKTQTPAKSPSMSVTNMGPKTISDITSANDELKTMMQTLSKQGNDPALPIIQQFITTTNEVLNTTSGFANKRVANKLFTENRRNQSMSTLKIHKNDMKKLIAESLQEMFLEEELAENYLEEMCGGRNLAEKSRELEETPMNFDRSKTKGGIFNKGTSANRMANRDLPPEAKHEPGENIEPTIPDLPADAPKDWPEEPIGQRLKRKNPGLFKFEEAIESVINEELYKDDIGLIIENILKNK